MKNQLNGKNEAVYFQQMHENTKTKNTAISLISQ